MNSIPSVLHVDWVPPDWERLYFTVEGSPVALPRQRIGRAHSRATSAVPFPKSRPTAYVSKKHPIWAYKQTVQSRAREARPSGWQQTGPKVLAAVFLLERPAKCKELWHMEAPDADNLLKGVADALTGSLWHDDCSVVAMRSMKAFADSLDASNTEMLEQFPGFCLGKPCTLIMVACGLADAWSAVVK